MLPTESETKTPAMIADAKHADPSTSACRLFTASSKVLQPIECVLLAKGAIESVDKGILQMDRRSNSSGQVPPIDEVGCLVFEEVRCVEDVSASSETKENQPCIRQTFQKQVLIRRARLQSVVDSPLCWKVLNPDGQSPAIIKQLPAGRGNLWFMFPRTLKAIAGATFICERSDTSGWKGICQALVRYYPTIGQKIVLEESSSESKSVPDGKQTVDRRSFVVTSIVCQRFLHLFADQWV